MNSIKILSFAKVNLSIDVTGLDEKGYHLLDMIMQMTNLYDEVFVQWEEDEEFEISLRSNKAFLPTDERNLAYKACLLMAEAFPAKAKGKIDINIKKHVPVAAGLAGGSGNGAALILALNKLWELGLDIDAMCALGEKLGSDVPFSIRGLAYGNKELGFGREEGAYPSARARGTGTILEPCPSMKGYLVLVKPPLSVSTKEVYTNIDNCEIPCRPDNDALVEALKADDYELIYNNMINVLENYTLNAYPKVKEIKDKVGQDQVARKVLMSGSGPTIFAVYKTKTQASIACNRLRKTGLESYVARPL